MNYAKELFDASKAAGFSINIFFGKNGAVDLYVQNEKDPKAIRHWDGWDFDQIAVNATQYLRNYDAYVTTAACCS